MFGLGLGDAPTAQEAVAAAYMNAFTKLTTIPLYRSHTIYNHIEHKYNSLKVRVTPAMMYRLSIFGALEALLVLCMVTSCCCHFVVQTGRSRS